MRTTMTLLFVALLVSPATAQERVKVWEANITVELREGRSWILRGWDWNCGTSETVLGAIDDDDIRFSHDGGNYLVDHIFLIGPGPENESAGEEWVNLHFGLRESCARGARRAAPEGAMLAVTDGAGHRGEHLLSDAEFGAGDDGRFYGFSDVQDIHGWVDGETLTIGVYAYPEPEPTPVLPFAGSVLLALMLAIRGARRGRRA